MLGRDFAITTEVAALQFPHVLTLRVDQPEFAGQLRFDIQRAGDGSRVRIRAAGASDELGAFKTMLIEGPVRSGMASALSRLKAIVEGAA